MEELTDIQNVKGSHFEADKKFIILINVNNVCQKDVFKMVNRLVVLASSNTTNHLTHI